ncbi:glycosyltransferase [Tardiphaga sp.]|uniref:glycosyltransferase n=1 Tax=Tardiphaga sp. TaxID=1926292 RepID=UPI0026282FE8|nr:glycosyltransferase [Tardiphaga sp.]
MPTFNESGNVSELVRRVVAATSGMTAEIIFVDDSTDDTPSIVESTAASVTFSVRLIHRDHPTGGLGGAVVAGFRAALFPWVLVMDGDLQHPPELIPVLADEARKSGIDIVVASRYRRGGGAHGLSGPLRRAVSTLSTLLTRAMFPSRLRDCTDPMTGYFLVRRAAVDLDALRPHGFKILLEILARGRPPLRVAEVPFAFGTRLSGHSKASLRQGFRFVRQLIDLRFGRASSFAGIGAIGALANLAIVGLLTQVGLEYLIAAAIAAESTIIANFLLQEHFVFKDLLHGAGHWSQRFLKSFIFNNAEALVRIPVLYLLVTYWGIAAVPATAITLAIAFVVRFTYHSRFIYAPGKIQPPLGEFFNADRENGVTEDPAPRP